MRFGLVALFIAAWLQTAVVVGADAAAAAPVLAKVDFNRDVQPILSDRCFYCHGPDAAHRKAKLRLDTFAGATAPGTGDDLPAVTPGDAAKSALVARITTADADEVMPPANANKKLSTREIEILTRWVAQGAAYDKHWSLVPPVRPGLPKTSNPTWAKNSIDTFVLAKLDAERLTPSPEARRQTLIRRVSLDLTGLPPTPAEVKAFVDDASPGAYERVVDRLLASPAFGERMAWDWLDAARYADSNGYQGDGERTMWPWRDWVIQSFNRNLPYDQFTVQQLAGDLMPGGSETEKFDRTLATGFSRNHMINGEGGRIPEENRVDYVFDQLETVGTVWLGLTFNCTRCHDHKFDPITQRDYYGLFAFFNQTPVTGAGGNPQTPPLLDVVTDEQRPQLAKLEEAAVAAGKAIDARERALLPQGLPAGWMARAVRAAGRAAFPIPANRRSKASLEAAQQATAKNAELSGLYAKLLAAREARQSALAAVPRVMVMADTPALARKTFILDHGLYDKPMGETTAAVPAVLPQPPGGVANDRLALARWLVSPGHPLTARVSVNRFWQQFFGIGLVKTVDDFGVQGERPKNQPLLDWLAVDFAEAPAGGGAAWDVKRLCRQIVTSATYRQSSRATPELLDRDPENRLSARGPRFRMPSWMARDQALAAGGLLVDRVGGPPVNPYQPTGVWEEATFGNKKYAQDHGDALHRRSLYTFWRRIVGPTAFFDAPTRQTCTVKQSRTNSPLHALSTLNDTTYVEAARALADRSLAAARAAGPSPTDDARARQAFRFAAARDATDEEAAVLTASVARLRTEFAADPAAAKKSLAVGEAAKNESADPVDRAAWAAMCNAILNLDEVLTKE